MTARNKDVRREWVVFCSHCRKLGLDITYRRSESFQCILKARRIALAYITLSLLCRGKKRTSPAEIRIKT
jgi:hypothetical protein